MIVLFAALTLTAAAVTALHLRSRPRGAAAPFPSFQHLQGLAPRRRPAWPIEEPVRWALRILALALAAAALTLARREERRPLAVLVEPGSDAWKDARAFVRAASGPALALTFEGERPQVAASPKAIEAGERARRTLAACSATWEQCLARAALGLNADALVVSSFRERAETYAALGKFRYVRAPAAPPPPPADEPGKPGTTRVVAKGTGVAARVWAAALAAAEGEMGGGETEITVADRAEDAGGARFALVPVVTAGPLARAEKVEAAALREDTALAAGGGALRLESSLALQVDASLRPILPPVLSARGTTLLLAATEEDLGAWAHSPTLMALARVVLFESGRGVRISRALPGSHRWMSIPSEETAPVGLLDVAPGRYERDDGRVELRVPREARQAAPLADDVVASRGGQRLDALPDPPASSRWPLVLLAAALALRLADAPLRRPLPLLLNALAVVALGLLAVDPAPERQVAVRRAVLSIGRLSLPDSIRDAGCALPGSTGPCVITARAAFANEAAGANAVVFPSGRPRVDILAWEVPTELRTGDAGLLRVTVQARRAAGRDVTLTARPTSGPTAQVSRKIHSDDEALTLSVPVTAVTEGVSFALVRAAVGEDGDSAVATIVTRSHEPRRLVLAAAPGWEARAAGEALARRGRVERLTRLGATAVLARGARPEDPLDRLSKDLSSIDLLVLSGFTREDLAGAREAALVRYVTGGGALLLLGGLPRLSTLPLPLLESQDSAAESGPPSRMSGTFGDRALAFQGFAPAKTTLPAAGTVLGRLEGKPWIVGRGFGEGRIAAVTAPDAWRAGTPGRAGYEAVLDGVVAWLEAGRAGVAMSLSPDLRSLETGGASVALPAAIVDGLPVDPVDPFSLLPPGPARERVLAERARLPFLEADSAAELLSLLARAPDEKPLPRRVSLRDLDPIWLAVCALLAAEVFLRRRAG